MLLVLLWLGDAVRLDADGCRRSSHRGLARSAGDPGAGVSVPRMGTEAEPRAVLCGERSPGCGKSEPQGGVGEASWCPATARASGNQIGPSSRRFPRGGLRGGAGESATRDRGEEADVQGAPRARFEGARAERA